MEQNLLEHAVAATKRLPDEPRNELSKLELFTAFEAAPSSFEALLDYEPFRDSLRFFASMCSAITLVRNKDGQPLADDSEKDPKVVELHCQLLRRALSAARGCLAIATYHCQFRVVTTLEGLISPEQDIPYVNGEENVRKEDITILRNCWLLVHAVLLSCQEPKLLSSKQMIQSFERLIRGFESIESRWQEWRRLEDVRSIE